MVRSFDLILMMTYELKKNKTHLYKDIFDITQKEPTYMDLN